MRTRGSYRTWRLHTSYTAYHLVLAVGKYIVNAFNNNKNEVIAVVDAIQMPYERDETDEQILQALRDGARTPAWLLSNLDLDVNTRSAVQQRLRLLVAADEVENIGHGLYQLPGGYAYVDDYVDDGKPDGETVVDDDDKAVVNDADDDVDVRVREIVDDVSESWDDSDGRLAARREAARAALQVAVERGSLSKSEAVRDVRPDHAVEGQNGDTWWRKNVRPVLQEVGEHFAGSGYVVDFSD